MAGCEATSLQRPPKPLQNGVAIPISLPISVTMPYFRHRYSRAARDRRSPCSRKQNASDIPIALNAIPACENDGLQITHLTMELDCPVAAVCKYQTHPWSVCSHFRSMLSSYKNTTCRSSEAEIALPSQKTVYRLTLEQVPVLSAITCSDAGNLINA